MCRMPHHDCHRGTPLKCLQFTHSMTGLTLRWVGERVDVLIPDDLRTTFCIDNIMAAKSRLQGMHSLTDLHPMRLLQ